MESFTHRTALNNVLIDKLGAIILVNNGLVPYLKKRLQSTNYNKEWVKIINYYYNAFANEVPSKDEFNNLVLECLLQRDEFTQFMAVSCKCDIKLLSVKKLLENEFWRFIKRISSFLYSEKNQKMY